MGFILTLLVVSAFIAFIFYLGDSEWKMGCAAFVVCCGISTVIIGILLIVSTSSYYALHTRLAKHAAYQDTVKVYVAKATPKMGSGPNVSVSGNEITDFKYQSYQGELSELLQYVRYNAAKYNGSLASKRAMALSWYWGALIVEPDDWMKPLTIE